MNNNPMPTKEELDAAAAVLTRYAAATNPANPEPEEPPAMFPDDAETATMWDIYPAMGALQYMDYDIFYDRDARTGKYVAAIYTAANPSGDRLDKLAEIAGAMDSGNVVKAALQLCDNVADF